MPSSGTESDGWTSGSVAGRRMPMGSPFGQLGTRRTLAGEPGVLTQAGVEHRDDGTRASGVEVTAGRAAIGHRLAAAETERTVAADADAGRVRGERIRRERIGCERIRREGIGGEGVQTVRVRRDHVVEADAVGRRRLVGARLTQHLPRIGRRGGDAQLPSRTRARSDAQSYTYRIIREPADVRLRGSRGSMIHPARSAMSTMLGATSPSPSGSAS